MPPQLSLVANCCRLLLLTAQEKRLISRFFEEISQDSGKYVFGVKDTLMCLDMGAVETLIVWEALDVDRYELLNTATQKVEVKHLTAEQVGKGTHAH
jgi:peptide chain release factor subunit 1